MVPVRLPGGQHHLPGRGLLLGPVTLTDHGQSVTATLFFDADGRLTEFVGQRYSGGDLETWSVPVTEYGEFVGLRLPSRAKAVWRHAGGDEEYIDVTLAELHHEA